jgi:hypothetical protein
MRSGRNGIEALTVALVAPMRRSTGTMDAPRSLVAFGSLLLSFVRRKIGSLVEAILGCLVTTLVLPIASLLVGVGPFFPAVAGRAVHSSRPGRRWR